MKPETAAFLAKSRECLDKAEGMLPRWPDEAGRAAYLAGFHAAQALLFETRGRTPKTHSGVQTQFARLVRDEPRIDLDLRAFLGRTYNLKALADYETGPGAYVSPEQARAAIETARRFVAVISDLMNQPPGTGVP